MKRALQSEIAELRGYQNLAKRIVSNAKGEALLTALDKGFVKLEELKARRKALILLNPAVPSITCLIYFKRMVIPDK